MKQPLFAKQTSKAKCYCIWKALETWICNLHRLNTWIPLYQCKYFKCISTKFKCWLWFMGPWFLKLVTHNFRNIRFDSSIRVPSMHRRVGCSFVASELQILVFRIQMANPEGILPVTRDDARHSHYLAVIADRKWGDYKSFCRLDGLHWITTALFSSLKQPSANPYVLRLIKFQQGRMHNKQWVLCTWNLLFIFLDHAYSLAFDD